MNDDKTIDYKTEYNRLINELSKLKQDYTELENDRDYIHSLLDVEFEKGLKLKKENEELKDTNEFLREKDRCNFLTAFYSGFNFSYNLDKESDDTIHLKDTRTSVDFKDGILTMIVEEPKYNGKFRIKFEASMLDIKLIR